MDWNQIPGSGIDIGYFAFEMVVPGVFHKWRVSKVFRCLFSDPGLFELEEILMLHWSVLRFPDEI